MEERSLAVLMITKVFILSMLCCSTVSSSTACTLEIWQGETQMNTIDVCELEYNTTECEGFLQSFNRSDLPYEETRESVERPESIDIVGSRTHFDTYMYPRLSLRWESPISDISRAYCYGFLLIFEFHGKTENGTGCRIFKFNSNTEIRKQKLSYRYNIAYAFQESDYRVRVYSMPPPQPENRDNTQTFVEMFSKTPTAYRVGGSPASWAPIVSYQTRSNGTVDVKFSLSPPTFNLTLFEVNLLESASSIFSSVNYSGQVFSEENPQGFMRFNNIPSGDYQIVVWVKDRFPKVEGECQCWEKENTGTGQYCSNICGFTKTAWFNVNVTEPPTPPAGTSPPDESIPPSVTSDPSDGPSTVQPSPSTVQPSPSTVQPSPSTGDPNVKPVQSPPSDNNGIIVGAVVGGIILIAFIIFILVICKKREDPRVKRLIKVVRSWPWKKRARNTNWTPRRPPLLDPVHPQPRSPLEMIPDLADQTLYLVSADDHEAHTQCVESLVDFLQEHCHCKVIYPAWDYTQDRGVYEWFQANMTKSSRIMFIDSVAAEKLTQAHLNMKYYRTRRGKPEDDFFKTGLKHLMSDLAEEERGKLVVVSFGGIRCQKYLQAPCTYELPDGLRLLLCKIHNIDSRHSWNYSSSLPMKVENISQLDKGAQLLSAISALKMYEASNPDWFKKSFGEPVAILQQLTSVMSDDSGYKSLKQCQRSVSQPDLSDAGSPSSDFNQPIFTPPVHQESMPPSFSSPGPAALMYQYNMLSHQYGPEIEKAKHNQPSSHGNKEPEWSIYTISSDQQNQPEPDLFFKGNKLPDGTTVIPPDLASGIDSCSNAFREINNISGTANHHDFRSESIPEADLGTNSQNMPITAEFQRGIQPPDTLSDCQLDSVSSAMAEINAHYVNVSMKEDKLVLKEEEDVDATDSAFDCVSI